MTIIGYQLLSNAKDPTVSFYAENGAVWMNYGGDGLFLFEVKGTISRANHYAAEIVKTLNAIKKTKRKDPPP